jgi:hypothetical protein
VTNFVLFLNDGPRRIWEIATKIMFQHVKLKEDLKSLEDGKGRENNSNLLECYIELKFLETIIALIININKTLCNYLY